MNGLAHKMRSVAGDIDRAMRYARQGDWGIAEGAAKEATSDLRVARRDAEAVVAVLNEFIGLIDR